MAKKLYIVTDMFGDITKNNDIFIADGDTIQHITAVSLDEVVDTVFGLVGDPVKDIDEIKLQGNKNFMSEIVAKIVYGLKEFYSNRNVRVSLNGEVCN